MVEYPQWVANIVPVPKKDGKDAGAMYQRVIFNLFHDMMHKEVKVYMDDMIVKSRTLDLHVNDLQKLFKRLRKYKLRLNLAKCTFGVKTRSYSNS
ncbi:Retrovirus-related Pol polyprotein from transposon 17.6, partial [Mucuna pruriens]